MGTKLCSHALEISWTPPCENCWSVTKSNTPNSLLIESEEASLQRRKFLQSLVMSEIGLLPLTQSKMSKSRTLSLGQRICCKTADW